MFLAKVLVEKDDNSAATSVHFVGADINQPTSSPLGGSLPFGFVLRDLGRFEDL
jgi:hypothetical protein